MKDIDDITLQQLSQLVYLDVTTEEFELTGIKDLDNDQEVNLIDFIDYYLSDKGLEKLEERYPTAASDGLSSSGETNQLSDVEEIKKMLLDLKEKPNVSEWKITNIQPNTPSGFAAFTVDTDTDDKIVVFRGSEPFADNIIDWINNFLSSATGRAPQHLEVEKYMKNILHDSQIDGNIYFTGHSLGGNLASFASMVLDGDFRDKLKKVITFNAPGFTDRVRREFDDEINDMIEKGIIKEYRSVGDMVPSFLYVLTEGIYIDVKAHRSEGFESHSMLSMKINEMTGESQQAKIQDFSYFPKLVNVITQGLSSNFTPYNQFSLQQISRIIADEWSFKSLFSDLKQLISLENLFENKVEWGNYLKNVLIPYVYDQVKFVATTAIHVSAAIIKQKAIEWKAKIISNVAKITTSGIEKAKTATVKVAQTMAAGVTLYKGTKKILTDMTGLLKLAKNIRNERDDVLSYFKKGYKKQLEYMPQFAHHFPESSVISARIAVENKYDVAVTYLNQLDKLLTQLATNVQEANETYKALESTVKNHLNCRLRTSYC